MGGGLDPDAIAVDDTLHSMFVKNSLVNYLINVIKSSVKWVKMHLFFLCGFYKLFWG